VNCTAQNDLLRFIFNEDELLQVWSPRRATIDDRKFRIAAADRVRWEWFYYGRPKIAENRRFIDFVRVGSQIHSSTNADWHPHFQATIERPAVEMFNLWTK